MLTDLREKSQSFLIYILFGILIIVFIFFFGPQAEGCQPGAPTVRNLNEWAAKVDGREITLRDVEISVRRQALFEQSFDDDRAAVNKLRRQKLEQVIDQTLIENEARRMGLAVDSKALSKYIVSKENPDFPLFRDRDGNFDRKNYRDQLQQVLGASPEAYRHVKERELIIRRYIDFLSSQIQVSEAEIKADFEQNNRSWNLEYVAIQARDYEGKVGTVTPEEGLAHAAASAKDVEAYYNKNKRKYQRKKEVKVRRILIRRPKAKADEGAAKKKAEDALAKAKTPGTDFGALAKEVSEGAYKEYDGVMGWQSSKNTKDYAVFEKLNKGDISPLQSDDIGYWFVKADDIRDAIDRKLEDVKGEIGVALLTAKRAEDAARKDADALLARVKTTGSLNDAVQTTKPEGDDKGGDGATSKGLTVQTTGPIRQARASALIPGIGRSPELAKRLAGLTDKNPLVDTVLKVDSRLIVTRLKERVEPDMKKLDSERNEIATKLKQSRKAQLFGSWQAILYGPVQQRQTFKQFGSSALSSLLAKRSGVKINESAFPKVQAAAAPAKTK